MKSRRALGYAVAVGSVCVCVWCVVERVECKYFFHLFEHRARAKRDFFPRRVYIRIDRSGGGERRTRGTKKKKKNNARVQSETLSVCVE